jgi:hypothetical protein
LFVFSFGAIVLIEEEFRLIVGSGVVDVAAEVDAFEAVVAVVDQLLLFLAVGEEAFAAVEADVVVGQEAHGLDHLLVEAEVDKEAAFGVDVINLELLGDVFEGGL